MKNENPVIEVKAPEATRKFTLQYEDVAPTQIKVHVKNNY